MKIVPIVIVILCLLFNQTFAQSVRKPISAAYLGSGAYSKKQADVFSFVNNQAALTQIKSFSVGVYGERRFMLKETSMYEAVLALPSSLGNFGINLKYFGFKNFYEQQFGFAYAKSIGQTLSIGIQFNYYGYYIPSYLQNNTITAEIGTIIHLSDKLHTGIHAYNPAGGRFLKSNEKLPAAYSMGVGYDASDKLFLSAEIIKEENIPVNMQASFQYNFLKRFFARAGISSATASYFIGFGIGFEKLRLDVSSSYHPQLGLSPGILLMTDSRK